MTTMPLQVESPAPRRTGRGAVALLLVAAGLGALTVVVAYGFSVEYADTSAGPLEVATDSLAGWAFAIALTTIVSAVAVVVARTRPAALAALAVLACTVVGTGAGAVLGAEEKYDRYPATPNCDSEFDSGTAMPVVRAAERAFEEIEHPGPFSGGGTSGVDGCASELMMRDGEDPTSAYRSALPEAGWRITEDTDRVLRAEQGDQAFEVSVDDVGAWTVWIGPVSGNAPVSSDDGSVSG